MSSCDFFRRSFVDCFNVGVFKKKKKFFNVWIRVCDTRMLIERMLLESVWECRIWYLFAICGGVCILKECLRVWGSPVIDICFPQVYRIFLHACIVFWCKELCPRQAWWICFYSDGLQKSARNRYVSWYGIIPLDNQSGMSVQVFVCMRKRTYMCKTAHICTAYRKVLLLRTEKKNSLSNTKPIQKYINCIEMYLFGLSEMPFLWL